AWSGTRRGMGRCRGVGLVAVVAERAGECLRRPGGDPAAPRVFDHPGLRVSAASPEHLLAMKVLAARDPDAEDIRFLVKHRGLPSVAEVLALCAEVFPDEEVPPRARLLLEDIFADQ